MFGVDPGRLDPLSSEFDRAHLDEVLSSVKSDVRRRRALTRLPVVLVSGFGVLVWMTLFQGSALTSVSAPVEVVGVAAPSSAQVAVGGDGSTTSGFEISDAAAVDDESISGESSSGSEPGGIESQDASDVDGNSAVPPRPVLVFDISTVLQDRTQAGPSSPPPAMNPSELDSESIELEEGLTNDIDLSSLVGAEDASREDGPFGDLDKIAASSEPSSNTGNPSTSDLGSEDGVNRLHQPVLVELAEGSTIDPDNPLHLTLRLRVVDPTGASAGACGSSVNWGDGSSTGSICDAGCSTVGGDGVDEILTFDHVYDRSGVVQVLVSMYTGQDCHGNRGSLLLSIQVGDDLGALTGDVPNEDVSAGDSPAESAETTG